MDKKTTKTTPTAPEEITIQGQRYPVIITMGAFLEYHRITGREATDITSDNLSDTPHREVSPPMTKPMRATVII